MADAIAIQACERIPGQDTCPFHPSHKITSLCSTCGILVCLECIMSKEHKGHEFKKISECLREPTNAIARYLTNIDKNLLEAVDRELDAIKIERKESVQKHKDRVQSIQDQGTNFKREIDSSTSHMVVQMDKNLQEILDSLDKHMQVLESLRIYLTEERKECNNVLQDGCAIQKFDIGNAVMGKANKTQVPIHPNIPDLQHIKCENSQDLIRKALGTLHNLNLPSASASAIAQGSTDNPQKNKRLDHPLPTLTTPEQKAVHKYSSIITQSKWSNDYPKHWQFTPITDDKAWARNFNERNQLCLISSTGQSLKEIQTDKNLASISVHPKTGQLYGGFSRDNTIRSIDTESGSTTVIVQCDITPDRIKVTKDNHVLVGGTLMNFPVYRYKLTCKLVHKSPETYNVSDMDQCAKTNRVVLSCDTKGVMILNNNLTKLHHFNGLTGGLTRKKLECVTAIFDSYGNLIVGDWCNKEVYILNTNQYRLIQKLPIKNMSNPFWFKLYQNTLWLQCSNPSKAMCIDMK